MKKLIFTLCFISASAFMMQVSAQACSTPIACSPTGSLQDAGFENPDTTPCVKQGLAYSHAIQFKMFSQFDFAGHQNVDSIEFVSVDNLPCGLCWSVDQADKRYSADEDGCLNITGTTNDSSGQYKLALSLKAWINHQTTPGLVIPSSTVDQTGIRMYLRVKQVGTACMATDTSSGANNRLASLNCTAGVNELSIGVSSLNLVPNPMNSEASLIFVAEKAALYTIHITDVTGKEVAVKPLDGKAGENIVTIERNNLSAGIYFLSLTDGTNAVTKRFSITE